ncbi:MAG: alpha-L-fucosidase [Acidobacteriaceae bacterium]|nr:alpha-L-fucosidase [Acidobacteriaceae bacterium]
MNRRDFNLLLSLGTLSSGAVPAPSPAAETTGTKRKWYELVTPGIHLDYHFPEWDSYIISKADGSSMIRKIAATKAEMVVVFAKCHYGNAYYNTKIGHKHKNLGQNDLLREWVAEARRQKLNVLAYYSVDRDLWAGQHNSSWRMKDAEGRSVDEDRYPPEWAAMGFLCYNSPYREFVKEQVKEILEYDIDGFHFDMLWFGHTGKVCYCDYCRPLFRKQYGIEMPMEPLWNEDWRKFLQFRYDSNARFCEELNQVIRAKSADVSIMYNYHGTPPNSWQEGMLPVRHRLISDYGTGEGYPMRFGHHYASFMGCFLANLKPGSPWQGVTSRYTRNMSDKTVRPLPDMTYEMMTYVSHGGTPLMVDTPEDDGNSLDPVAYERMGALFREVKAKIQYFGYEPVRRVGIYFSAKTRDWYGREDPQKYFASVVGAHRILVESHIPVAFVFDEDITLDRLQQFPLIYLANTAIMSERERELIQRYVEAGGRILATFETSRFDEYGREQSDFGLASLFGAHYTGKTQFKSNYFRVPQGFASRGFRPDWDLFLYGPNNVVEVRQAATLGELKLAFHDRGPHTHMGHAPQNSPWKSVGPAMVRRRMGRGEVVYVPFSPEAMYMSDSPLPEHRMFVRNVLESLLPQPDVSVSAPLNIESVLTFDSSLKRFIIHLIGFIGVRDAHTTATNQSLVPLMEEMWRYRARINLQTPPKRATVFSRESDVRLQGTTVELDGSQIHEIVVLEL